MINNHTAYSKQNELKNKNSNNPNSNIYYLIQWLYL